VKRREKKGRKEENGGGPLPLLSFHSIGIHGKKKRGKREE